MVIIGVEMLCTSEHKTHKFMKHLLGPDKRIHLRRVAQEEVEKIDEAGYSCRVMSKDHANMWFTESDRVYVQDNDSHHGTFVRSGNLTANLSGGKRRRLLDGDVLIIGKELIKDGMTHSPIEIELKFIVRPNTRLSDLSPGRYAVPLDIGDSSDSEFESRVKSESHSSPHHSAFSHSHISSPGYCTPKHSRAIAPLPSRSQAHGYFIPMLYTPKASLPPPYASQLSSQLPSHFSSCTPSYPNSNTSPSSFNSHYPPSPRISPYGTSKPKPKSKLTELIDQMEDVKTAVANATAKFSDFCLQTGNGNTTGAADEFKTQLEGLQSCLTGFQDQQERMLKDQAEQMELIKKLETQIEKRQGKNVVLSVPGSDKNTRSLKRSYDDSELSDSHDRECEATPPNIFAPEIEPAGAGHATEETLVTLSASSPPPPKRVRMTSRLPSLRTTASTVGTLGVGAAMMWIGLASL